MRVDAKVLAVPPGSIVVVKDMDDTADTAGEILNVIAEAVGHSDFLVVTCDSLDELDVIQRDEIRAWLDGRS